MNCSQDPCRRRPGKLTPRRKRQEGLCLDGGKNDLTAFRTQKIRKIRPRLVAEKILFPERWCGGMISVNSEVIWEMLGSLFS